MADNRKWVDERFEDENLNPAERHESELVFNRPDQANLPEDAENESDYADEYDYQMAKNIDAGRESRREAERNEWEGAAKWMNNQKERSAGGEVPSKKTKRRNIITGGIAAGLLSIGLAFFALLPMKVPSIANMVTDEAGQLIERMTIRRAKVIMAQAMLSKFGYDGGVVITGNGPMSSLIATMRTDRMEKKLAAKGIEIIEVKGQGIRLKLNGNFIDNGDTLKSARAVEAAMQGRPISNKVLNDLVKEEIPTWRVFKRMKFATWMRIKYGIPRFGIPENSETNKTEKVEDIHKSRMKEKAQRLTKNILGGIGCFMGDASCPVGKDKKSAGQQMTSETTNQLNSGLEDVAEEFSEDASKKVTQEVTETYYKFLINKLGTKFIPIIGWIDLVATLDHVAYNFVDDDYFQQVPAYFRGVAYAQLYAEYAGYGSQFQLGEMDRDYGGVIAKELDGAEESAAYSCIQNGTAKGRQITARVDENNPSAIKKIWEDYKATGAQNIPGAPLNEPSHLILNAYYETIGGGGLLGLAGDGISLIIGNITSFILPDQLEAWFGKYLEKMISKIAVAMGWAPDPEAPGFDQVNFMLAGADKAFSDQGKDMGGGRLSNSAVIEQRKVIAQERSQEIKDKGWVYAMFSPDYTKSLTTQLAVSLPSAEGSKANVSQGITQLASLVASTPSRLLDAASPMAGAAQQDPDCADFAGVKKYGATEAQLALPVDNGASKSEPCPEVAEDTYNACKVDSMVASCILAYMFPENKEPNLCKEEEPSSANNGAGGEFRIATFNLLGAGHTSTGNAKDRTDRALDIIRTSSDKVNPKPFDIVGLQEVDELQRDIIIKEATEYDIYPPKTEKYSRTGGSRNSIIYNNSKFTLVEGGKKDFYYFNGEDEKYPYVKLADKKSGQQFIVFNTHDPTSSPSRGNQSEWRKKDAVIHLKNMEEANKDGTPVFMTGDFNSAYVIRNPEDNGLSRDELTYCIMTSTGKINNALDLSKGRTGEKCPIKDTSEGGKGSKIDHIYATTGIEVPKWQKIDGPDVDFATDHPVVFADIVIPGAGGARDQVNPASLIWPIAKGDWPTSGMPIAECGLLYSDGTVHTGIDIGVTNKPVVAAADGKVVYAGGAYGAVIIETNLKDGDKTLYLNYQHLSAINVSASDVAGQNKVKQGQKIGTSGDKGAEGAFHLHFGVWTTGSFLNGHMSPNDPRGKNVLSQMRHPMNYLPNDGRNINECKPPYVVPGSSL